MKKYWFRLMLVLTLTSTSLPLFTGVSNAATYSTTISPVASATPVVDLTDGTFAVAYNPVNYSGTITVKKLSASGVLSNFSNVTSTGSLYMSSSGLDSTSDNSIYLGGGTSGQLPGFTTGGGRDPFLVKINSSGTIVWSKQWTGSDGMWMKLSTNSDDSVSVVLMNSSSGNPVVYNYSSSGNLNWTTTITPSSGAFGDVWHTTSDNSGNTYVVVGGGTTGEGSTLLYKINSLGDIAWHQAINLPGANNQGAIKFNATLNLIQVLVNRTDGATYWSLTPSGDTQVENWLTDTGYDYTSLYIDSFGYQYIGASDSTTGKEIKVRKFFDINEADLWVAEQSIGQTFIEDLVVSSNGEITFTSYNGATGSHVRKNLGSVVSPSLNSVTNSTPTTNQATVSGTLIPGLVATEVEIHLSQSSDMAVYENYSVISGSKAVSQNFTKTFTGLTVGTTYYYQVKAFNYYFPPTLSSINSFTIPAVPSAPIISANRNQLGVTLAWNAPNTNGSTINSYYVYQMFNSDGNWTYSTSTAHTGSGNHQSVLTFANADAGKLVSLKVKAISNVGDSEFSNVLNVQLPEIPNSPSGITTTADSSTMTISWSKPSNWEKTDSLTYSVEATTNGVSWSVLTLANRPTATSAVFDSPMPSTSYRFRVTASNFLGSSTPSSSSEATTLVSASPSPSASSSSSPSSQPVPAPAPAAGPVYISAPSVVISAPNVTVSTMSLTVRQSTTASALVSKLGIPRPAKSTVTMVGSKATKSICRVSGSKVTALKPGACVVTITVQPPKPKKGKRPAPIRQTVTINTY